MSQTQIERGGRLRCDMPNFVSSLCWNISQKFLHLYMYVYMDAKSFVVCWTGIAVRSINTIVSIITHDHSRYYYA